MAAVPGGGSGSINGQSETRREVNHGLHTERLNESSTEASSALCVMRLLTTILRIRRLGRNQHPRSEPVAATTIFLSKPTQITKLAENHILFDLERQFHDGMDCFQTASCSVSATSWFPVRSRHTLTGEKTQSESVLSGRLTELCGSEITTLTMISEYSNCIVCNTQLPVEEMKCQMRQKWH